MEDVSLHYHGNSNNRYSLSIVLVSNIELLCIIGQCRVLTSKLTRISAAAKFSSLKQTNMAEPLPLCFDAVINVQGKYVGGFLAFCASNVCTVLHGPLME